MKVFISLSPLHFFKKIKWFLTAVLAVVYYRYPAGKLKVVGVSGTDGKTTTCHLIYSILKASAKKTALISTVKAVTNDKKLTTGLHTTTPSPFFIQKLLRRTADHNFEYVILETTSHALDQYRVLGCNFFIGVITNITPEHLDYHISFKKYQAVKAKLIKKAKFAILNYDDHSFHFLKKQAKGKTAAYSLKKQLPHQSCRSEFPAQIIKLAKSKYQKNGEVIYQILKIRFNSLERQNKTLIIKTKLLGDYNASNILAAITAAKILKVSNQTIQKAVESFQPVKGRFEVIKNSKAFWTIVDFAHTPNALENLLTLVKKLNGLNLFIKNDNFGKGAVSVVFGCAGERDHQKRPAMGEIACQLADVVILTAEDPRTEDVNEIIQQIEDGCKKSGGQKSKNYFAIPDRCQAIEFAVQNAKPNDIILICGKGHEESMCYGKKEYSWSDQKAVKKALSLLKN